MTNVDEKVERAYRNVPQLNRGCYTRYGNKIPDFIYEFLAEFFGTALIVGLGCGGGAAATIGNLSSPPTSMSSFEGAFCFALAIIFAIYAVGGVSGGHFNPSITFAYCMTGRCPVIKFLWYFAAQLLGSMLGGGLVYAVFNPIIWRFERTRGITRGTEESAFFSSIYHNHMPKVAMPITDYSLSWFWLAFSVELILGAVLLFIICAIEDRNQREELKLKKAAPLVIGVVFGLLIAIAYPIDGGCLNPIRDFGPRIIAYIHGYGSAAFPGNPSASFYCFLTAPPLGAVVGTMMYDYTIGAANAKAAAEEDEEDESSSIDETASREPADVDSIA